MTTALAAVEATEAVSAPAPFLETDPFQLAITVVEQGDIGGLVRLTDDGCGSTCTACTTG